MSLHPGWSEYYSSRAAAPYFVHADSGETTWVRPTATAPAPDGNPTTKRARTVEPSASSGWEPTEGEGGGGSGGTGGGEGETMRLLREELDQSAVRHQAEVDTLKAKIIELGARGNVAAGEARRHHHPPAAERSLERRAPSPRDA